MGSVEDGDAQDSKEAGQNTAASRKNPKAPSPQNCRNFIRKQTADAMPEIVKTFVNKAKEGSVPHFTSLAKVGGFDQRSETAEAPRRKRRSLARQLLDEERYEAQQSAGPAGGDAAETQIGGRADVERVDDK